MTPLAKDQASSRYRYLFLVVTIFSGLVALRLASLVYPQLQVAGYHAWNDPDFWLMLANGVLALVHLRMFVMLRRPALAA